VKSLVNDEVEMLGVDVAVELVVELDVVEELDDEPHPAATSAIAAVSTAAANKRELKIARSSLMGAHFRHRQNC